MTVYVIETGEYSDRAIEAIFTNKAQAELYCAAHGIEFDDISEWETDTTEFSTDKPIKAKWVVRFAGTIYWYAECYPTVKDENSVVRHAGDFYVTLTLDRDTPKEKVKKIACDRLAKYRSERIEPFM